MINVNSSIPSGIGAGTNTTTGSPKWHVISRGNTRANAAKKANMKKKKSSRSAHQKPHATEDLMDSTNESIPSTNATLPLTTSGTSLSFSTSTSTSFSASVSTTAVSPSVGKKLSHDNHQNLGMCGILDSPKRRKVSLSWKEDSLSPSKDQSMLSADLDSSMEMNGSDDDDDEGIPDLNANDAPSLKRRISELENEYQKVLVMVEEARRSVAEEQKRKADLLEKREALVRRHFNAAVLRAKLEMSKKEMMDGSCSPALNMSMGQLYDEAVQQGISPEMYNSWIHTRLTGINTN